MRAAGKPFTELTAEDLMSRNVVAIRQEMSLAAAARVLSRAGVTGAPVVDADGVCVGVVSATDFLRLAEGDRRGASSCACSDWQVFENHELPAEEVRRYMTHDPVTIRPGTTVGELARLMLDAHIHRLIVVDRTGHPVGVVSSTDVLAAVAVPAPPTAALAGSRA
jgi:CBS domain-containing membrane protein